MKRPGFTLVEILVALTIFALVGGALLFSFGGYLRGWRKLVREVSQLQIENYVAERVTTELRAADPAIAYAYEAGKVQRKKNSTVAYLTSAGEVWRFAITPLAEQRVGVQLNSLSWEVDTP